MLVTTDCSLLCGQAQDNHTTSARRQSRRRPPTTTMTTTHTKQLTANQDRAPLRKERDDHISKYILLLSSLLLPFAPWGRPRVVSPSKWRRLEIFKRTVQRSGIPEKVNQDTKHICVL